MIHLYNNIALVLYVLMCLFIYFNISICIYVLLLTPIFCIIVIVMVVVRMPAISGWAEIKANHIHVFLLL